MIRNFNSYLFEWELHRLQSCNESVYVIEYCAREKQASKQNTTAHINTKPKEEKVERK